MSQVKVFVTDRQTDGQIDEWVLMSPTFAKGGEQKLQDFQKQKNEIHDIPSGGTHTA